MIGSLELRTCGGTGGCGKLSSVGAYFRAMRLSMPPLYGDNVLCQPRRSNDVMRNYFGLGANRGYFYVYSVDLFQECRQRFKTCCATYIVPPSPALEFKGWGLVQSVVVVALHC